MAKKQTNAEDKTGLISVIDKSVLLISGISCVVIIALTLCFPKYAESIIKCITDTT